MKLRLIKNSLFTSVEIDPLTSVKRLEFKPFISVDVFHHSEEKETPEINVQCGSMASSVDVKQLCDALAFGQILLAQARKTRDLEQVFFNLQTTHHAVFKLTLH